jgi:hypothetical protein
VIKTLKQFGGSIVIKPLKLLEQIPLERFLAMSTDDLRGILAELATTTSRARRESPFDHVAIGSLIRVMDRNGYQRVSVLGPEAAKAWAARVGIR